MGLAGGSKVMRSIIPRLIMGHIMQVMRVERVCGGGLRRERASLIFMRLSRFFLRVS